MSAPVAASWVLGPAELRVERARLRPGSALLSLVVERPAPPPGTLTAELRLEPSADPERALGRAWLDAEGDLRPLEVLDLQPAPASPVEREDLEPAEAALARRRRALDRLVELSLHRLRTSWRSAEPPLDAWTGFFELFRRLRGAQGAEASRLASARERSRRPKATPPGVIMHIRVPPGPPGGRLRLELRVPTRAAWWRPRYELRAQPGSADAPFGPAEVQIRLVAEVHAHSEHPWRNVDLELVDVEPPAPAPLPELGRIVVSGFQGPPISDSVTEEIGTTPPLGPRPAQTFRAPASVSLPSAEGPERLELLDRSAKGRTMAVVDLDRPETLRRRLVFDAPCAFARADAELIWRGAFVARARLGPTRAGERVVLELGPVEGVDVRGHRHRAPIRRSRGSNRLEHGFAVEVELEDRGAGPLDVELRGRLPVAGSSDVEVEIHELPEGTAVDPNTGFVEGVLRLPANARRAVRARFSVHAPRTVVVDAPD